MKGKKGGVWWFNAFFIFVILFILGVAFGTIYAKTNITTKFGDLPKTILETYHKGEKILFYVDYAAKNSIYQAAYDLGQKGGVYEAGCGDYLGYNFWQDGCYPNKDSLKNGFGLYLNDNLNNYLLGYPEEDAIIPYDNYDFLIKDDRIVGIAIENIEFDIKREKKEKGAFEVVTEKKEEAATKEMEEALPKIEIITKPGIDVSDQYYGHLNSKSRIAGVVVDTIILHHTGGSTFSSGYNTLTRRGLSVHYMVDIDGTIYYLVDEGKLAYHASGWNARSIGIEIVNTGKADMDYTDKQYTAVFNLVNNIVKRWPTISFDNTHIIGHYQASEVGKWDPSPNFEWARIGLPSHETLTAAQIEGLKEYGYA